MIKKKENFTIFGSTGFLGQSLKEYLNKKHYRVVCPKKENIKFKKNLGHVFYCSGTSEAISNPQKALDANLNYLSKLILNNKFKSFTYFSSIRVYSSNNKTSENAKIIFDMFERGVYFKALKLAAESLCLQINNPNIRVIRLANLYGHNFKNQIYLFPTILRKAKNNQKITLTINPKSKKNYIYINDAIKAILKIIKNGKFRLYNLGSNSQIKISQILSHLKKIKKINLELVKKNKVFNEPKIEISKIKKEFILSQKLDHNKNITKVLRKYLRNN